MSRQPTDQAFLDALQDVFDANHSADGIDRHDGYGRDYRIVGVRIIASDDGFDDLEVAVRHDRETLVSRVLFDREWREASGLVDARSCAAYVAATWSDGRGGASPEERPARRAASNTDELWRALEASLVRDHASVNRVRHGVLELVDEEGEVVTIHMTPQQWGRYVDDCEGFSESYSGEDARGPGDGITMALSELDEQIGSRWDDEDYIVYFRGDLHHSIRAELPPVRSLLLRDDAGQAHDGL